MGFNIGELRATYLGNGMQYDDPNRIMTLEEATTMFALDEAFLGKRPVAKIQAAMDNIYKLVMADPKINLNASPQKRLLENAFCDVFGFASCSIYWANRPGMGMATGSPGPCTMPQCKILHQSTVSFKYGTNQKGFYDERHELRVYINTDQTLFTEAGLSSEEMLAVLLHEVGHNFDYSVWTLVGQWYSVIEDIVDIITAPTSKQGLSNAINLTIKLGAQEFGGGVVQALMNLDDMIMNVIPPIGMIMRSIQRVGFNVLKLIQAVLSPLSIAVNVPIKLAMSPFRYLSNTSMRKGEIYSDSFAAVYGYGPEQMAALEKMSVYLYQTSNEDTFLAPFYDLMMLQADIVNTLSGGHGSTQQRALRMMDKLDHDLEASGLTSADKAAIRAEKDRFVTMYNKFLNADTGVKSSMTSSFRRMIDNWYAGKNYMFVPMQMRDQQYAE